MTRQAALPVVELETTAGTKFRAIDKTTKAEYVDAMKAHAMFPPVIAFAEKGSARYVVADGFHRIEAAIEAGYETILCEIHDGDIRAAKKYAFGANDQHGLRRTNKVKRRIVTEALKDREWVTWANTEIASMCRVGEALVRTMRRDMVLAGDIDEQETVKVTRSGKTVEQKAHPEKTTSFKTKSKEKQPKKQGDKKSLTQEQKKVAKEAKEALKRENVEQANCKTLMGGLDAICSVPRDGAYAANHWRVDVAKVRAVRQWCDEFLSAKDKAAA